MVQNAKTTWLAAALLVVATAARADGDDFSRTIDAEPGGTLRVRLDTGSVHIESHDEDQVRVEAHASGPGARRTAFELDRNGSVIELRGDTRGGGFSLSALIGGPRVKVEIRVPEVFSVDVRTNGGSVQLEEVEGKVEMRTSGGSVEVDGVRGDVELHTSGGSIRAEGVHGRVVARTSGGHIDISEVDSADVRTSGGHIELLDVGGRIEAHTSGGHITARFAGRPEGLLKTSGGNIAADLPEDAAVSLDARTHGGKIEVEQPIFVRGGAGGGRIEGDINGGGPKLELHTSGGSIRIGIE